ncbi:cytochrome b/b6 domain-containing protein [Parasphingorhabdus sp.]|uniref:cytochrome b/b6 domain-containing protein n=1 Tax=Parasphingorhabdus sp. TaxID=2709688 RepID=UPI003C773F09
MSNSDLTATAARIRVWDAPLRLFHWLLVIAIAVAFLSAEEESPLNKWHIISGWVAAILIAFRLIWGFAGGEYARFSGMWKGGGLGHHISELLRFKPAAAVGHNPLGWISALLLIAVSIVTIWTGALIVTSGGEAGEDLHEIIGWSLLGLVVIHIVAVFVMSLMTRDNLVRAMITGYKRAGRHAGVSNAQKPSLFSYLVGFATIAAAIFGILTIDPQAFVPRSTESAEHGQNQTGYGQRDVEHDEIDHQIDDE